MLRRTKRSKNKFVAPKEEEEEKEDLNLRYDTTRYDTIRYVCQLKFG
jgi:hypothetical protein